MKKKLFAIALAVLPPLGLLAGSGDVNGDGKIDITDIVELVRYLNGNPSDKFIYAEADANADGSINYEDVDALAEVIMAGHDYIKVAPKVVTMTNDKKEFNVMLRTDLNVDEISVYDTGEDYLMLDYEREGENGIYKYHFVSYGVKSNYSGEDWEAWVFFRHWNSDAKDSVKIIYKGENCPTLTVLPKAINVIPKEYGRDFGIELDVNYEWLIYDIRAEIDKEATWLHFNGQEDNVFYFTYDENYTGKDLQAQIVFKVEQYNLSETVTVTSRCGDWVEILPDDMPERWVRAQKREYNLIGIGSENAKKLDFDMVLRTGGIEDQNDIGCEIIGDNTDWLELGPITILGCYFSYARNESNEVKTAKVRLYDKNGDYSDEVTVNSLPINFMHVNDQNHVFIQPDGDEIEFILYNGAEREVTPEMGDEITTDSELLNSSSVNYKPFIHHISNEVVGNDLHIKLKIDPNSTDEHRWQHVNFPVRYTEGCQKLYIGQAPKSAPSASEMRQALVSLYNSTNGDYWYRHKNWNTDKPLSQWELLTPAGLGDYVWAFDLSGNTLIGTIPKDFGTLMEIENTWRIDDNGIYGKIPDAVVNHPKWQEKGWGVVKQGLFLSGRKTIDWSNLNLKLDDYEIDDVKRKETSSNNILAKYKVSVIMAEPPSDEMINLHMSYHNKGYGTVLSSYEWGNIKNTRDKLVDAVQNSPIDIEGIWNCSWADDQLGALRTIGSWYVFDNEAKLLACLVRDWDIPESWYVSKVDSICRAHLGEPEEHEIYHSTYYTSSDYSKDGEVTTLQTATVGKGIDIVLMGDAYVDKDMDKDGKYEKDMQESMEYFFAVEPYKTLRNRFNVYSVKVISPNDHIGDDCVQKLNYDDAICFQYAQKVEGIDMDNVTVVNIVNNPDLYFAGGHANMYENGSSVAHIEKGGPSSIIVHEAGGHGFAKLLDEYIFGGYEENHTQEGANESFRNWIKTDYHDKGWGMNISATDNPDEVPWAHFLKDDRYKDEIGIYKGAWMWPEELWRPSENSVMNRDYSWFNAPSREAIYKRVMKLSEGDSWSYDYETFVSFDAPARQAYSQSRARARQADGDAQQKRIESRPPTIYKGTWRDAGKCEKVEYTSKP